MLFKTSCEFSTSPKSFGSNGALGCSILSLQLFSCSILQRPGGDQQSFRAYHSHWSSALFDCFCQMLCAQPEGAKQQGLLPCAGKEHTAASMKEEVTKVTESSERNEVGNSSSQWVMESIGDQPLALTHALKSVKHAALGACCFICISSFLSWRTRFAAHALVNHQKSIQLLPSDPCGLQ